MVILSRIYTKTGDAGTTDLGDMSRTHKTDPRLVAYADTDEANCAIGEALADTVHLAQVADALRLDRFAVMGSSSGGSHALACAAAGLSVLAVEIDPATAEVARLNLGDRADVLLVLDGQEVETISSARARSGG